MNRRIQFLLLLLGLVLTTKVSAQGTAFSYQGRLGDNGSPATGIYDFQFGIFNAVTNGSRVSVWQTNSAVPVTNGLFTATLDFGTGIFTGNSRWLDISVRTNGVAAFTTIYPRQPVLPVPYAIFANTASNVLGTVSASQINGGTTNQIALTNSLNVFAGTFSGTFGGAFSGNGAGLTNLNGSNLASGTVADARLSANVALLNANQTFTGTNTFTAPNNFTGDNQFTGANNFTNFGNSFSGSFFGNGLVGWIVTNSLAFTAVRDHGYTVTNSGLVTITLPLSANLLPGDIIRIAGAGAGGWLAAANSGQTVFGCLLSFKNCIPSPLPTSADYRSVASSADGTVMYAAGLSFSGVLGSTDSGRTWSQVGTPNLSGSWVSVACSANGKIVYAEPSSGAIQKSTNYGGTWATTGVTQTGNAISCTADGGTLFTSNYACSGNGTNLARLVSGAISISTNSGSSWLPNLTAPTTFSCVGASSDCTKLVAGNASGFLYASANRGASWTQITSTAQSWSGAWMSPDGSKFAATVSSPGLSSGTIYAGNVLPMPFTVTTNSVGGSQGSAMELQFLGNSQFMPVSSIGSLWAN